MFQKIWQIVSRLIYRRRTGLDSGDIEHLRADLRFRLALLECAYFGKSGRRVARRLTELKSLLGEKGTHRYLNTLDPELRAQFVERIQGARHDRKSASFSRRPTSTRRKESGLAATGFNVEVLASNVVPIKPVIRKSVSGRPTSPAQNTRLKQNTFPPIQTSN